MRVNRSPYHFKVTVAFEGELFPKYKLIAHTTAKVTLKNIPKRVYKTKLQKTRPYCLHISFVSPSKIKTLNAKYRNKNKITDVLSFSQLGEKKTPIWTNEIGEVLVCAHQAKKQAPLFSNSLNNEICRLVAHGILHLFGYDHEKNLKEKTRMFRLQDKITNSLANRFNRI